MTEQRLKQLLRQYPDMIDKLNNIDREIEEIKGRIDSTRNISAMIINGMPHVSNDNNPTLQKATRIIDTFERDIDLLLNNITEIQREHRTIKTLLNRLTTDEYIVIELKYFNDRKWEYIERQIHLSRQTCFRIHDRAVKKMLEN